MKKYNCIHCNKEANFGHGKRNLYCSIQCQNDYQISKYIEAWLAGNESGSGVNGTKLCVKRYLLEQQNSKCAHCGINEWNGKPIVLELEHKDGNSDNNRPENLECLCPNCHSQTPTYKNRNKGNGRHARRVRYSLDKSY